MAYATRPSKEVVAYLDQLCEKYYGALYRTEVQDLSERLESFEPVATRGISHRYLVDELKYTITVCLHDFDAPFEMVVTEEEYRILGVLLGYDPWLEPNPPLPFMELKKMIPAGSTDLGGNVYLAPPTIIADSVQSGLIKVPREQPVYVLRCSVCSDGSRDVPLQFFCGHVLENILVEKTSLPWKVYALHNRPIYVLVPMYGFILHPVQITLRVVTDWQGKASTTFEVEPIDGDTFFAEDEPKTECPALSVAANRVEYHLGVGESQDTIQSMMRLIFNVARLDDRIDSITDRCTHPGHGFGIRQQNSQFVRRNVVTDMEALRIAMAYLYTLKVHRMCYICYRASNPLFSVIGGV